MKNNWFQIWNCQPNQLPLHHTNKQTENMTTSAKTNELLGKIISQTVPTQLLEIMKKNRPYNNEVDATMINPHFRTATLNIIARGVQVTHFTDGKNELYFFGEGVNTQIWNGCSVMSR